MAVFFVTGSNWNSSSFWAAISETSVGHALDFTGLGAGFAVDVDPATGIITISNGSTTFTIGQSGVGGTDANFGGLTQLEFFDTLVGGSGDNVFSGGNDADFFDIGLGEDTLIGGEGGTDQDTLSIANADDVINITFTGNEQGTYFDDDGDSGQFSQIEVFELSLGDDTLDASAATTESVTVFGLDGNDSIIGGGGDDIIEGGDGTDIIFGGDGDDTLRGGADGDTITGGDGTNNIYGNAGNDRLVGNATDALSYTLLSGGAGADTLDGTAGNWDIASYHDSATAVHVDLTDALAESGGDAQGDTLIGIEQIDGSDNGNDTIVGDAGVLEIKGFGGDDDLTLTTATGGTVFGGDGSDTITGGAGNDSLDGDDGSSGADSIDGGGGNDTIIGDGGNDTIIGGAGDDEIYAGADDDSVEGDAGSDLIYGQGGNDVIQTKAGNDTVYGGEGNDVIDDEFNEGTDGSGQDQFFGEGGNDTIHGGLDNDTIDGGTGNDWISGESGDNLVVGGDGDDTISMYGHGGSDTIEGGADADLIDIGGDFGITTIRGGEATTTGIDLDEIDLADHTAGVTVTYSGNEAGEIVDGADTISFSEIEQLTLSDFADSVDGSASSFGLTIHSGAGDDTIIGGDGNDHLFGDADNDSLSGGLGSDTLEGGTGADTLFGGADNDSLSGGSGDDEFTFGDNFGDDTITDFDMGDTDLDGFTNDQLNVSDMTGGTGSGGSIRAWDITTGDDGFGNAVLIFPNGERIVLQGVTPAEADTAQELYSMGVACFAEGTLISTPAGEVPIESLGVGDLVVSKGQEPQRIKWLGNRSYSRTDLKNDPSKAPIRIAENVLGNHSPLFVSSLHGMVLGPQHGLSRDMLVRAKHLAEVPGRVRHAYGVRGVRYFHLLLPQHSIIFANGAESESFFPGFESLCLFGPKELGVLSQTIPGILTKSPEQVYGPRALDFMRRRDVLARINLRAPGRFHQPGAADASVNRCA